MINQNLLSARLKANARLVLLFFFLYLLFHHHCFDFLQQLQSLIFWIVSPKIEELGSLPLILFATFSWRLDIFDDDLFRVDYFSLSVCPLFSISIITIIIWVKWAARDRRLNQRLWLGCLLRFKAHWSPRLSRSGSIVFIFVIVFNAKCLHDCVWVDKSHLGNLHLDSWVVIHWLVVRETVQWVDVI